MRRCLPALLTIVVSLGACRIPLELSEAETRPLTEAEAREAKAELGPDHEPYVAVIAQADRATVRKIAHWRLEPWITIGDCETGEMGTPIEPRIENLAIDDHDGLVRQLAARPIRQTFELRVHVPRSVVNPGDCLTLDAEDGFFVKIERHPAPMRYGL
jgi:hypothetical protein